MRVHSVKLKDASIGQASYTQAMERLIQVIQKLSLARNLNAVIRVVRLAARDLTGSDGATFVLKEGNYCYYADENAISPLWKGQRFPIRKCISGWVMQNRKSALIQDIYQDSRIPHDVYRPTFVKSLLMVPVREKKPIAAIGNYWAQEHLPTSEEVGLLQSLANTTAIAIENIQLYSSLEQKVKERTAQLETVNKELEAFSYSVSHDLKAPLTNMVGFSELLLEMYKDRLDERGQDYLERISKSGQDMAKLITGLLQLSRLNSGRLKIEQEIDLSLLARNISNELQIQEPARKVTFSIQDNIRATGDQNLLQIALRNMLENSWKYTSKTSAAHIEFGKLEDGVYYIRDNGAGFDMADAKNLFKPFKRLHDAEAFSGTGIGLATVLRIINSHCGKIWAESEKGKGATFYFSMPPSL